MVTLSHLCILWVSVWLNYNDLLLPHPLPWAHVHCNTLQSSGHRHGGNLWLWNSQPSFRNLVWPAGIWTERRCQWQSIHEMVVKFGLPLSLSNALLLSFPPFLEARYCLSCNRNNWHGLRLLVQLLRVPCWCTSHLSYSLPLCMFLISLNNGPKAQE